MVRFTILILVATLTFMTSCSSDSVSNDDELYEVVANTEKHVQQTSIEKEVMQAVNEYRTSIGLNSLDFSAVAYKYAKEHNDYMIGEGIISHDNFDKRASDLSVEAKADYVSENLGMEFKNAADILEAWKNSPTHKKVMEGSFSYTAVGVSADENGTLYFTQLFYK